MVGRDLTSKQLEDIELSRVVHSSIDPSVAPRLATPSRNDEDDTTEHDPDRVITNSRRAMFEDGLLSDEELLSFFRMSGPVRSVYDDCLRFASTEHDNVIGARLSDITPAQKGFYEPMWTSYTHYWKTTLGSYHRLLHRCPG